MIGGAKGIGIGIDFGIPNQYCRATSKPYIEKDVLDSLRVVASAYGKSNNDADRSIVKNLVDASNPFVISNAAFKLNSGFGEYEQDFTDWGKSPKVTSFDSESIKFTSDVSWVLLYHPSSIGEDIPSFKVRIKLYGEGTLYYNYITQEGTYTNVAVKSEIFETPICYNTKYTGEKGVNVGFTLAVRSGECSGTITQIPSFEDAFVTDGIDDLITSTKTVQEMLDDSKELTVVSMTACLSSYHPSNNTAFTNYIRNDQEFIRSYVTNANYSKYGIYGYSISNIDSYNTTAKVINNILGDKEDYKTVNSVGTNPEIWNNNFSVVGYLANNDNIVETSQVAWYWTIIANKVLTTDQINQVIAYFNLDRTLNPDILCNVKKQGITNENHAEFGDKLIDFSGNGRDIQLNNIAWKGDSGIGKYEVDFLDSSIWNSSNSTITSSKIDCKNAISHIMLLYYSVGSKEYPDIPSFKVIKTGADIDYRYIDETGAPKSVKIVDGVNILPASHNTLYSGSGRFCGFGNPGMGNSVTITQIPSHAGALCLDGVNDFGKVTGMPIYKDYTVVTDREIFANIGSISSKNNPGAFVETAGNSVYSFGKSTSGLNFISTRSISYLSKYSYCGQSITAGAAEDGTDMWLGTIRDNDSRFFNGAIYSLMSFPYSMSEFLIERQLKKHKLGTLYPDMVEFRPIVPKDDRIKSVRYYIDNKTANIGQYYPIGSGLGIAVETVQPYMVRSLKVNGVNTIPNVSYKGFNGTLDSKSPQKIAMDIQVDSSLVLFNPTINSNAIFEVGNEQNMTELIAKVSNHEIDGFIMYLSKRESKYILPNSWINKDTEVIASIYCLDNTLQDDLHINIDGNSKYCLYADSSNNIAEFIIMDDNIFEEQYITNVLTVNTIDIQLDQYIRYEDIVQPYPVVFQIKDRNTNQIYSWGDKIKVGSSIQLLHGKNPNLLSGLYSIKSYEYEGENYTYNQLNALDITLTKSGIQLSCNKTWVFDNNEPKCILSPRLLRIPNSSYKILGYIPDISGHGNNGVINNSAYAEGSGVNEDGSYQFDGVDDFITIPTLSRGGKQVLMKVNWNTINSIIYDQRGSGGFAIYCSDYNNPSDSITVPAYRGRNAAGTTYIDGIRNEYIIASQLRNVTHNIVEILDTSYAAGNINPIIGKSYMNSNYGSLALYDFMLFDNISTDDKIKELNEYVGIQGNVWGILTKLSNSTLISNETLIKNE